MDAMDILGALLGNKAGTGGSGGAVLKDILTRGQQPQPQSQPRQHPQAKQPRTIDDAAKSLEDLLGVGGQPQRPSTPAPAPKPVPTQAPKPQADASPSWTSEPSKAMDEQSKTLVRAMVKAAKSDGQVSREEQDKILKQLQDVSQEDIDFLKATFNEPLDVRQFTWDVPLGLEEQVYTVSLISIDLDEQKEADYLAELAHGLRLAPARCNAIHQKYGAPIIFRTGS